MIANTEVIVQDQLIASVAPGKVRVLYPRGASPATLLAVDTNGKAYICPLSDDGAYQQATVLANGNVLYLADRATSVGTLVLGAGLRGL